jgi:hypothetical protein
LLLLLEALVEHQQGPLRCCGREFAFDGELAYNPHLLATPLEPILDAELHDTRIAGG